MFLKRPGDNCGMVWGEAFNFEKSTFLPRLLISLGSRICADKDWQVIKPNNADKIRESTFFIFGSSTILLTVKSGPINKGEREAVNLHRKRETFLSKCSHEWLGELLVRVFKPKLLDTDAEASGSRRRSYILQH